MVRGKKLKLVLLFLTLLFFYHFRGITLGSDSCDPDSTLTGSWQYPPDWCQTLITGPDTATLANGCPSQKFRPR